MRYFPRIFTFLIIALLLQACTDPDKPTIGLYVAVKRGDIDQIERHIFWKTDINQLDIDGQTPLHEASRAGRMIVAKLLLQNGAEVNKLNSEGKTALYVALQNGRTQLAEMLIAKFNAQYDPTSLLLELVKDDVNDRDVIRYLTGRGADINAYNSDGDTPLIVAVRHQQRLIAKHLIANNADVNLANSNNELPLAIAKQINNPDLISLLHSNGAKDSN